MAPEEELLKFGILGIYHHHPNVMLIMPLSQRLLSGAQDKEGTSMSVGLYSNPNSGLHLPHCCWSQVPSVFSPQGSWGMLRRDGN